MLAPMMRSRRADPQGACAEGRIRASGCRDQRFFSLFLSAAPREGLGQAFGPFVAVTMHMRSAPAARLSGTTQ